MSETDALDLSRVDAYQYSSLKHADSIRLLHLHPHDSSDATLNGELIEVRLSDTLEFEALSYVWGEEQCQTDFLRLDGAHFQVSETLSAALRVFRLADKPRILWIDAICVDQKNNAERSCQVAQMSVIYRSAAKVLVWLGESTPETRDALLLLRDIARSDHRMDFESGSQGPNWFHFGSRTLKRSHEDVMRIIESTAEPRLDDIFGRPWFTRLWIIQEIALARSATLHCGHESIEWDVFAVALSILQAAMNTTKIGIAYLGTFQKAWHVVDVKGTIQVAKYAFYMSPYNELAAFLALVKDQKCRDDRDRIYALLGLGLFHLKRPVTMASGVSSSITPDYTKSTSEVYTQVARHHVMKGDLFLLHHAALWRRLTPSAGCSIQEYQPKVPAQSLDYLPSWVPDFSSAKSFNRIAWFDDNFSAGLRMSLARVAVDSSAQYRIHVIAKTIGIIQRRLRLLGLANSRNVFESVCSLVQQCISRCREESYTSNLNDLPLTLMADGVIPSLKVGTDIQGRVPDGDVLNMWHLFLKHCLQEDGEIRKKVSKLSEGHETISSHDIVEGLSEEARKAFRFFEALCDVFEEWQFMIDTSGRIGLVPLLSELGDAVVIIPGLATPYLLRMVSGSEDAVVIGPCYVRGVMNGEVVSSTDQWDSISLI